MPNYAVSCCGHPLAQINDQRPHSRLVVESDCKQIVIGGALRIDDQEVFDTPQDTVTRTWADAAVSETLWGNSVFTWVIRCRRCGKQAELSQHNLNLIADALAGGDQHDIPLGVLCDALRRLKA
jgi:hypothetical protein